MFGMYEQMIEQTDGLKIFQILPEPTGGLHPANELLEWIHTFLNHACVQTHTPQHCPIKLN